MQHVLLLIAAAATSLVLGCQQATAPRFAEADAVAPVPPHETPAAALKAEGDALAGKANHRAAVEVYRRAVALVPPDTFAPPPLT